MLGAATGSVADSVDLSNAYDDQYDIETCTRHYATVMLKTE